MKKIFIILLTLISSYTYSQTLPYPPGSYNAMPELDKFVGTWVWSTGNDMLELRLYKQAIHYPAPLDYDVEALVGWHKYLKNGATVESSLQYVGLPFRGGHSSLLLGPKSSINLYGTFHDLTKEKRCDLYLTMSNNNNTQMTWKLTETRGVKLGSFQWGFTLPTELILTKQ